TVESVKSVSECFIPLAAEIVAVNEALADRPELVNTSPYGEGWMVRIRPEDPAAFGKLLTAAAYQVSLKGGA
ncbi:MAG: glycine cleavage system protein H, partial [Syntrophaceae bacterium]|nr:glycine cleavage system protein H [Syntrophaceae bacterium]